MVMFVRQKKNKSGVVSVQIIDKSSGSYKVFKTIGSSEHELVIENLVLKAKEWIKDYMGSMSLDFYDYKTHTELVLEGIDQINVQGTELLLGKIFDQIGFNAIDDPLLRQLTISRLCFPVSKLKTSDFLSRYHSIAVDVQRIYRYLDKLHSSQKELVQEISYRHTLRVLNNKVSVVFYDVTTIYFESESEDDLRKTGFSKEGKHQNPQIVLGLLVSKSGYPLAYEIFEGNKFEGHTMLPVIDSFKSKYDLKSLVVVADAGLLSSDNIELLQGGGYEYILGARIKAESQSIKRSILSLNLKNGESRILQKDSASKLVISYSDSRARKDAHNRERGLKKLEKQKSGKLTKSSINNRGYNKFLRLTGTIEVVIDEEKRKEDSKWDGLKGYLTNTTMNKDEIIENYQHLWMIEKAFRIAKTDLKVRPIYHRLKRRIEAHICISFIAYKVFKELERLLKEKNAGFSPEKAIEIARSIYAIRIVHPISKQIYNKTVILSEEQKKLADLFEF